MTRSLCLAAGVFAALVLQPLVNDAIAGAAIAVSLPALVAVLALFLKPTTEVFVWTALAGLVSDVHHVPPLGLDMLCLTTLAFLLRQLVGVPFPATMANITLITAVTTFCMTLASATSRALWAGIPAAPMNLMMLSLHHTAGNALVALFVVVTIRIAQALWTMPRRARLST